MSLSQLPDLSLPDARERVIAVRQALPSSGSDLSALAASLPSHLVGLTPELCLELSRLARDLRLHAPTIPADVDRLPPLVWVHWRRTQLICGDSAWVENATDAQLCLLLGEWSPATPKPMPLLQRLTVAKDRVLRSVVLQVLADRIADLTLAGSEAIALLATLAKDEEESIRAGAVELLAAPWLFFLSPGDSRRRAQAVEAACSDGVPKVAAAALKAAGALGLGDAIRGALKDETQSLAARQQALRALVHTGSEDDIPTLLRIANQDVLAFGAAARHTLLRMHRRGVFVREPHLDALLTLYDLHHGWTGDELVRVTYLVRAELIERLRGLGADDPRWRRRAAILGASYGSDGAQLLASLLTACTTPSIAGALIDAAGAHAQYTELAPIRRWFEVLPERALRVLHAKGDATCVPWLSERALAASTPPVLRRAMLDVIWAHSPDRDGLMRELAEALGPKESMLSSRLSPRQDPRLAALIAKAPWDAELDPCPLDATDRLGVFAASGDPNRKHDVVQNFRQAYRHCLKKALAGDFSAKRIELPRLEQRLYEYGRHLVAQGYTIRRWVHSSPETGRDFVLLVAREWLEETTEHPVRVALLETIARHAPSGPDRQFVERYWRHSQAGVQRAAIEAILSSSDSHGLELSISRLSVKTTDARVLVQALRGIRKFEAGWAAPMAARCLDHPNMSVKKEAADALAALEPGTRSAEVIGRIVNWLAVHDNPGFRRSLKRALARFAGKAQVAWLVLAAERSEEPRALALLLDAMSGLVGKETVLLLARQDRLSELVDACVQGETAVADASTEEVISMLHRALPERVESGVVQSALTRLQVGGFSAADAALALADYEKSTPNSQEKVEQDRALRRLVRQRLPEWLQWQATLGEDQRPAAESLILAAVTDARSSRMTDMDPALADTLLVCAESLARGMSRAQATTDELQRWSGSLLAFAQLHVASGPETQRRLLRVLRALEATLAVDGLKRFRLIKKLGGVRNVADLECSLRQAAMHSRYAALSAALLCEAFRIPAADKGEEAEVTELREFAHQFHGRNAAEQTHWLQATLERRPIDVPVLGERTPRTTGAWSGPDGRVDMARWIGELSSATTQVAQQAADHLLGLDDARSAWPEVLTAYLEGRVRVPRAHRTKLASLIADWPRDERAHERASALVTALARSAEPAHAELHRAFIADWLRRLRAGDERMAELLGNAGPRVLPFVADACSQGDPSLLALLRPSAHLRPFLVEFGLDRPEVAHLISEMEADDGDERELSDPLIGLDEAGLVSLIRQGDVARGLAVRAVHELGRLDAAMALRPLCLDRRPPVRSAALRNYVRVASKEEGFAVSLDVLHMESRPDIVTSLMRRLAHGRYQPALPLLIERLWHGDNHVRQHAQNALVAWGPGAIPGLRRALRKARPDRRPAILQVIAELEQGAQVTDADG